MSDGTGSMALLFTGIVAFVFACGVCFRTHAMALESDGAFRQKQARIQALNPEFKTALEGHVATTRLLDQVSETEPLDAQSWFSDAARAAQMPTPMVEMRDTTDHVGGRTIIEITVRWEDAEFAAFQNVLAQAEMRKPPMRLKSVELKARAVAKGSIIAAFETIR